MENSRWFKSAVLCALLCLFSTIASARYLGNPAEDTGKGSMAGYLAYSAMGRGFASDISAGGASVTGNAEGAMLHSTFILDYGLSGNSALRFEAGTLHSGYSMTDGPELGFGYRKRLGKPARWFGKYTLYAMQFGLHGGTQADPNDPALWKGTQIETEAAVGVSISIFANHNFYFGALASYQSLSFDASGTQVGLTSSNPTGGYLGWEYVLRFGKKSKKRTSLKLGAEYHFDYENGVAGFARFRF